MGLCWPSNLASKLLCAVCISLLGIKWILWWIFIFTSMLNDFMFQQENSLGGKISAGFLSYLGHQLNKATGIHILQAGPMSHYALLPPEHCLTPLWRWPRYSPTTCKSSFWEQPQTWSHLTLWLPFPWGSWSTAHPFRCKPCFRQQLQITGHLCFPFPPQVIQRHPVVCTATLKFI